MASIDGVLDKEENYVDGEVSRGRGKLVMFSGSSCIPKDTVSKPQGDDAHFICSEKQTIGVADGVGGWSQEGIDAGKYARQLMSNAETALHDEPCDTVDPKSVLKKAWRQTKAAGSSTACILSLQHNSLRVVNMGDSGFMLIRQGEDAYKSPIQQHHFNYPYQLANDNLSINNPKKAQVFNIAVKSGDIVIAATDGLFDNLHEFEIEAAVRSGMEQGLTLEDVARAVAGRANYASMDKTAWTPFAEASAKAGGIRLGRKRDDITVIVSHIVDSDDKNDTTNIVKR